MNSSLFVVIPTFVPIEPTENRSHYPFCCILFHILSRTSVVCGLPNASAHALPVTVAVVDRWEIDTTGSKFVDASP